ncbi:chemotaxis protein CheX [Sulfurimonas sp.]|uniref:chemotaxis protein CheX n=1 Tax=Sulfurimonas sp. TaxID=2022749 RepID=UPI002628F7AE|nr:chemotaxis protein CheX [Sulfurimonas sp.]
MLNTIEEATKNFCTHQIGERCETTDRPIKETTYIAYIDISSGDGKKYRIYLALEKGFLQKISKLFLEEDESDDETLQDMLLETVNLIVGSAKVIAENLDKPYNIGTPFFQKIGKFDYDYNEMKTFCIDDNSLIIAIKELDA